MAVCLQRRWRRLSEVKPRQRRIQMEEHLPVAKGQPRGRETLLLRLHAYKHAGDGNFARPASFHSKHILVPCTALAEVRTVQPTNLQSLLNTVSPGHKRKGLPFQMPLSLPARAQGLLAVQ